jgi:hypothetical protein
MAGNEKCFSLVFPMSSRAGGGQKIYRFRSTMLGTLSLFAVPGADGTYEVAVNDPFSAPGDRAR